MTINLKNRNFLKLLDFKPVEIQYLIDLSRELKAAKKAGTEENPGGQKHRADFRKNLHPHALRI